MDIKTKEIAIDTMVAEDLAQVRDLVKSSRNDMKTPQKLGMTLYDAVLSRLCDGTRNDHAQVDLLGHYETALAVFRSTALGLRTQMDVLTLDQRLQAAQRAAKDLHKEDDEPIPLVQEVIDAKFLSNRYALAFAGYVGLALLDSKRADTDVLFSFGSEHDASTDRNDLTFRLARKTTDHFDGDVQRLQKGGLALDSNTLRYTLEAVFTTWINQFSWDTFKDVAQKRSVDDVVLRFGNYSMSAGAFRRSYDQVIVDGGFMKAKRSDVIGNEDYVKAIWKELVKLTFYDFERKENPANPAACIFTYGGPGCGKTYTAHALIREFEQLCKSHKIPFWATTHSTTDYASKYQNETANQLMAFTRKIQEFNGLTVVYISDADNIFPSRSDPDMRIEQRQTLDVYMRAFDGTLIPKTGRVLFIMDANYVDGIDEATRNRVFDKVLELQRFKSADEFAQYAKSLLYKGNASGSTIADGDWLRVGEQLLNSRLSNREITHIVRDLRGGFEVDESMIGMPSERIVQMRSDYMHGITADTILDRIGGYISHVESIEADSINKKLEKQYGMFASALAQQGIVPDKSAAE